MIYDYSNFNSGDENISIGDDKVSILVGVICWDPNKFIKMNSKYVLYACQNSLLVSCKLH